MPDLSKFKCYRFSHDGSLYYGEVAFLNIKNGHMAQSGEGDDWKLVRHGYGMNMFNGNRNEDGILTKYEGYWDKDKKHGDHATAVFQDGSTYTGSFKKDKFEGNGKYEWAQGHKYEGQWKESQMDGNGTFTNANGRVHTGVFKRNFFLNDKTFINPLDDEKKQEKNIKYYDDHVLSLKEKHAYEKRTRLYKISNDQ